MNLLSIVNSKFESLYSKEERSSIKVTLDDIDKIINIARIPLPEMLKSVLEEGEIYCLKIKETSRMTNDYIVAVEEGATHVRVGTAIFGARNYS